MGGDDDDEEKPGGLEESVLPAAQDPTFGKSDLSKGASGAQKTQDTF